MVAHNFVLMTQEERIAAGYPKLPGFRYYWCKNCDSVVRYSLRFSERDVNKLLSRCRLFCIGKMN